jgi:hypothetical protein
MNANTTNFINMPPNMFIQQRMPHPVDMNYYEPLCVVNNNGGGPYIMNCVYVPTYWTAVPVYTISVPPPLQYENRLDAGLMRNNLNGNIITTRSSEPEAYFVPDRSRSSASSSYSDSVEPSHSEDDSWNTSSTLQGDIPGITVPGVTQTPYGYNSKQNKITKIIQRLQARFANVLADRDEKVVGADTISVNVKKWKDLSHIVTVLDEIDAVHPGIQRLALVLTSKNVRQKKGFVCYFRVHIDNVEEAKQLLLRDNRFEMKGIRFQESSL